MTITADPTVREVLRQATNDPAINDLRQDRVWSPGHLSLLAATWGLFFVGVVGYLSGVLPLPVSAVVSAVGIYLGFTPLHDATHKSASTNPRVNDLIGTLSGFLLLPGLRTKVYRHLHVEHHRWVGDRKRDPDYWFVAAPKPLLPFVLLVPELAWTYWFFRYAWSGRSLGQRLDFIGVLAVYIGLQVGFLVSPWAGEFLLVYLLPQKLAMLTTAYAFAHIQHPHGTDWSQSPFKTTVHLNRGLFGLNRVVWLGQGDHCLHHFFPQIPYDRYHGAWELGDRILTRQAIPQRGFVSSKLTYPGVDDGAAASSLGPSRVRQEAYVTRRTSLTAEVDEFELEGVYGLLPFTPGAHVLVYLPSGAVRNYSLAGSTDDTAYVLAIKRESDGRGGSIEAHEVLTPGATIEVSEPINHFELVDDRAILVAGGIGVTPLLSMAHRLSSRQQSFKLILCGRSPETVPYADRIDSFGFADHVTVRADTAAGDPTLDPAVDIGPWPGSGGLYVCGPAGFMKAVTEAALELGWPIEAIHTESFGGVGVGGAGVGGVGVGGSVAGGHVPTDRAFTLKLARSGRTIEIPADRRAIDVLVEERVPVTWSCGQGVCGTCVTPVLSGTPDHRDAVLSDAQRDSNESMCLCVSRALTSEVVVDL